MEHEEDAFRFRAGGDTRTPPMKRKTGIEGQKATKTRTRYEAPTVVDLGALTRGQGACNAGSGVWGSCGSGTSPTGACKSGGTPGGTCNSGTNN